VILAIVTGLGVMHARQVAVARQQAIDDSIAAVQVKAAADRMRRGADSAEAITPHLARNTKGDLE
jgi:Tfp pilus assembly protein PilV